MKTLFSHPLGTSTSPFQRFRNLPLKFKIILYYLPLSLLPLIAFALFSNHVYEDSIIKRTTNAVSGNNQLIVSQIETLMNGAEDCANLLTFNINNIASNRGTLQNPKSKLSRYNAISNELSYALLIFPMVESIAYVSVEDANLSSFQLHITNVLLEKNSEKIAKSTEIEALQNTTGQNLWFKLAFRDYLVKSNEQLNMTLGKKIINITTGETLGYLFVNLNVLKFQALIAGQESNYFILDDTMRLVASNTENTPLSDFKEMAIAPFIENTANFLRVVSIGGQRQIISNSQFTKEGWQLVSQVSLSTLTEDLAKISYVILAFVIFVILLELFASNILSTLVTKPIKELIRGMDKVGQGLFGVQVTVSSKDELGFLAQGFNKMSFEIKDLLSTIKKEQKKKREYELALIQEQIKPHFLYNCLDVIYTLSMMGRNKDAARATKALADYYRVSLSKGADIITISEELNNVRDYLELQKIRYSDVFDYTIETSQDILNCKIMKLTLQPLVENAIYHGLKSQTTFGHIYISGNLADGLVTLTIKDTGAGIAPEELIDLMKPTNNRSHYGLYNVQDRIQLFFGTDYGLSIVSILGEGTTVTVTLPENKEISND